MLDLAATFSLLFLAQMSKFLVRLLGARIAAGIMLSFGAALFPALGGLNWQTAFSAAVELALVLAAFVIRRRLPTLWRRSARMAKSLLVSATWLLAAGLGVCAFLVLDLTGSIGYAAAFGGTAMAFAAAGMSMLFGGDRWMQHAA
jgi:hypothetical protein